MGLIFPTYICCGALHFCAFITHVAALITTGVIRYSEDGFKCALSTAPVYEALIMEERPSDCDEECWKI